MEHLDVKEVININRYLGKCQMLFQNFTYKSSCYNDRIMQGLGGNVLSIEVVVVR